MQTHYNQKIILQNTEANQLIFDTLNHPNPSAIARIGSVEQECLYDFFTHQNHLQRYKSVLGDILYPIFANNFFKKNHWSKNTLKNMYYNAGFFPISSENLEKFVALYLECVQELDILGVWFNKGEQYLCENYCQNTHFVTLKSLEPYYHPEAWSRILADKKVLVIHPFIKSIENQYHQKRAFLFENPNILPNFQLKTIKAIQGIAGNYTGFEDWFEALDSIKSAILTQDFDVALIGAGAYGLPLATFVKKIGKKAVHLGGALQILFGIKGRRWEEKPFFQNLFNTHWIKPLPEETPPNAFEVEKGCYW